MPPRRSFDKATIIEAAFNIVREEGWDAVTARSLAKKLNSSTMPLYSSVKSMDEIKGEIQKMAAVLMHEYQRREYTSDYLLNGAVGYVMFAKDEKQLFRFMFVENGQYEVATASWSNIKPEIPYDGGMDIKKLLPDLSDEAISMIIQRSWIFTHGLAMMVNSEIIPFQQQEIQRLLAENGEAQTMFIISKYKERKE